MLASEQMLTLSEAAKLIPGHPHPSSLWRWCRKGVKARDGQRIHLDHHRFGGRLFTSVEALDRFGAALAAVDVEDLDQRASPPARRRSSAQRERDIAHAEAELAKAGL